MDEATVVRWEADSIGVTLKLWIEEQDSRAVHVAMLRIEEEALVAFGRQVAVEQNRSAQHMLHFDR